MTDGSGGTDPAWSAAGSKLAFVRSGDVYVMNADGSGGPSNITNTPKPECSPTWSPDGTKMTYVTLETPEYYSSDTPCYASADLGTSSSSSNRGNYQEIYVMNADGSGETIDLTENQQGQYPWMPNADPTWSPDGTKIAFVRGDYYFCSGCSSSTQITHMIFTMNAIDGSNQLQRTDAQWVSTSPDWSPDGAKIAFASNRYASSSNGYSTEILL